MRTRTTLLSALALSGAALLSIAAAPRTAPVPATPPATLLSTGPAPAAYEPVAYEIDGTHSSLVFQVTHLDVAPFYGRFNQLSGEVNLADDPAACSVKVEIAANSVDTNSEGRDRHLQSPDFLAAEEFPTISFESTKVRMKDEGEKLYSVTGDLELHGVKKEITFDIVLRGPKTTQRGEKAGFGGSVTINRRDFGITTYGNDAISDEIVLHLGIEANKK